MASTTQEQGTGKHKHKSAEEPFPHNEASSTSGSKGKSGSSGEHASSKSDGGSQAKGSSQSAGSSKSSGSSNGSDDLKSREYTGPDGEIHHHTRSHAGQK